MKQNIISFLTARCRKGAGWTGAEYPARQMDNLLNGGYGGCHGQTKESDSLNILGNLSVVGAGLALYEQKWWCLIIAVISALIAAYIAWRSNR